MLMPKKQKFRKSQRGRLRGKATKGNELAFGQHGLQSTETGYISNRQIESARRALTRHIKRKGKVWIRIFPDKVFTKIPAETRMGKGKGSPEIWSAPVKRGTIIFEIGGISDEIAYEALTRARHKLSVKSKFIKKEHTFEV